MQTITKIHTVAAFTAGGQGGNPAGVMIRAALPDEPAMQRIAAEMGYSETVFAAPAGDGWRVRYFSPDGEVPFCGDATIALGAVLAQQHGDGIFPLTTNHTRVTVEAQSGGNQGGAALSGIVHGEDREAPGHLRVQISDEPGSSIRVSGRARMLGD